MVKKSASINLIKTSNNELSGQIMNWMLTIGRILIIIVEIIALTAFIYRFILDNQLREINIRIKQEQEILNMQKHKEAMYRNLQDRLNLEAIFINQGKEKIKIFKDVTALTPQGVTYTNYALMDNKISIQLSANSVIPISIFINSLKTYSLTDYISIDIVENRTSTALINVGLVVNLKNKGGLNENTGNN